MSVVTMIIGSFAAFLAALLSNAVFGLHVGQAAVLYFATGLAAMLVTYAWSRMPALTNHIPPALK